MSAVGDFPINVMHSGTFHSFALIFSCNLRITPEEPVKGPETRNRADRQKESIASPITLVESHITPATPHQKVANMVTSTTEQSDESCQHSTALQHASGQRMRKGRIVEHTREVQTIHAMYAGKIASLEHNLESVRSDYASLRSRLEQPDALEPGDVRQEFIYLRSQVDNYCRDLADSSILFTAGLGASNISVKHPEYLDGIIHGPPISLLHSTAQKGGVLVDFVECGLAVIVNTFLHQWIYNLFHPQLNFSDSDMLFQIYNNIRLHSEQ